MKNEIENLILDYNNKLKRKENKIRPFIDKKNISLHDDKWCTEVEYINYKTLESEINLLKVIISDLEDIIY